jgi:hypothetical protein
MRMEGDLLRFLPTLCDTTSATWLGNRRFPFDCVRVAGFLGTIVLKLLLNAVRQWGSNIPLLRSHARGVGAVKSLRDTEDRMCAIAFVDKWRHIPLQAADLLAYLIRSA